MVHKFQDPQSAAHRLDLEKISSEITKEEVAEIEHASIVKKRDIWLEIVPNQETRTIEEGDEEEAETTGLNPHLQRIQMMKGDGKETDREVLQTQTIRREIEEED